MNIKKPRGALKRRYAPKSRTGCSTCKIRRVKCDETRPHCQRCMTSDRECDGYPVTARKSLQSLLVISSHPSDVPATEGFEFFVVETVPCLSGYFGDELWSKAILQLSHDDSVVQHAINALGALHKESYCQRTNFDNETSRHFLVPTNHVPTGEYTAALTGLRQRIEKGEASLTFVLVCTVLFAHFEFLRGTYSSGIIHLHKSMEMLQSAMQSHEDWIEKSLLKELSRLDLQASLLSCTCVPALICTDTISLGNRLSHPADAYDLVNRWTRRFYRFVRTSVDDQKLNTEPPESENPRMTSLTFLDAFETIELILEDYIQNPKTKLSPQENCGIITLQIRAKINRILAATFSSDESILENFNNDFESILNSVSHIMQTINLQKLVFSASFDEGLLHPLDFVGSKCRDPDIRKRAVQLMKRFPSHAGMWHVSAITKIVERIIQFEEHEATLASPFMGLSKKMIVSNHVLSIRPTNPGSGMKVRFIEWPVNVDGASVEFEEDLQW